MIELLKGTVTPKDYAICGGIIGAIVLLAAGFYVFIYNGQQNTLTTIATKDEQIMADLRLAQETQKNIGKLREEAGKMNELVTQFEQRLPESREIPTLGLKVQLSQLPRITDARKETSPYSVKAWGSFHQIVSFINRLERFQRYLKVSDLKISAEEEGVAEASFTLSTFRFIQPEEGGTS